MVAWPWFAYRPKKFNFFALSLGAIIADLEVPILWFFVDDSWKARGLMHSLLGAVTIDLIIVVLATIYIVPKVLGYLDRKIENKTVFKFAGVDLREHKSNAKVIIFSTLIGTLSHLLLDALHHPYNPITYPIEKYYSFNLILFNDLHLANITIGLVTGISLFLMLYFWYFRNLLTQN